MSRRMIVYGVLLAAACLVFWAVRARRAPAIPPSPSRDAIAVDAGEAVLELPPRLVSAPVSDAQARLAAESGAAPPPTRDPALPRKVRIHGRVRGMEPTMHAWHRPFVYAINPASPPQVLGKVDVDADGAYALELTPTSEAPFALEVGARVPGKLPGFRNLMVEPGSDVVLDLEVTAGSSIAGRVVTREGNPVPGIELMLNSPMILGMISRVQSVFATMDEKAMLSRRSDAYGESRCVTDQRGYFTATGLPAGGYTVWTTSTEWFIRQQARVNDGAEGVELVAEPGLGFELRIVEQGNGTPVANFGGMAEIVAGHQHVGMSLSGTNGTETFVWSQFEDEARSGFAVDFRVTSDGFAPGVKHVDFRPGERFKVIELQLARQTVGSVTVRVVDVRGRPVSLGLVADLLAYPAKDERMTAAPLNPTSEAGRFLLQGRSGRWLAEVRPAHELGVLMKCASEFELTDRAEVVAQVTLPAFGSLRLVRPSIKDPKVGVTVSVKAATGGRGALFLLEGAERTFAGVPVGTWAVTVVGDALAEDAILVDVREDETTTATFVAR